MEKGWAGVGDLQRLESTARPQKRRDWAGDISRNQLAVARDAEEGTAVRIQMASSSLTTVQVLR